MNILPHELSGSPPPVERLKKPAVTGKRGRPKLGKNKRERLQDMSFSEQVDLFISEAVSLLKRDGKSTKTALSKRLLKGRMHGVSEAAYIKMLAASLIKTHRERDAWRSYITYFYI